MSLPMRRISTLGATALAIACLAACGKDEPTVGGAPPTATFAEMVGTWTGEVHGSAGNDVLTMTLRADSTISQHGNTSAYPPIEGRWRVDGDNFVSVSTTAGTEVTQVARSSKAQISGQWSSTNGASGTFTVTKQ